MAAKKSNNPLTNAKRLLQHLQEKAMVDEKIEFKEVRSLADSWMKFYMLESKYKVSDDESGLSELQSRLHTEENNGQ